MAAECMDALQYMPRAIDIPDRRLLLFLPLSHVFARFMATVAFAGTLTLGLTSNMKTIIKDFEDFGPTLLLAVPRVFEKVYNAASQRAGTGFAGRMFARGVRVAREWSKAKQSGNGIPAGLRMRHAFYDAVVYKKIRTVFGRNADFAITGGAPMDSDLAHFYNGIGMPLLEGYGMTETSGPFVSHCLRTTTSAPSVSLCAARPQALPKTVNCASRGATSAWDITTSRR